jgi:aconitate hydratase
MKSEAFETIIEWDKQKFKVNSLKSLQDAGFDIERLPYCIRILVENMLRNLDHPAVTEGDLLNIINWQNKYSAPVDLPFFPSRVLMQDFTGIPAIVDFAAMRDALKIQGKDPTLINPSVPVDLIVDHSIQIDYYGSPKALEKNVSKEYERNRERYKLLKWAQKNFSNFRIVPPNSGICHQVNLEYLSKVVMIRTHGEESMVFPDSLIGTDSHTTMVNGIGVMGWGVGGIEAEAVILGQPYFMSIPEVIGVELGGRLGEGVTTTDLVLTLTQKLRERQVVEKFVEYFGPAFKGLSVPERATIANMAPEYGATMGFFPVDERTIEYLRLTNRNEEADLTEFYTKANMLFLGKDKVPDYTDVLRIDLEEIEPVIAGPSRPQDTIFIKDFKSYCKRYLGSRKSKGSFGKPNKRDTGTVLDGNVVIAAITSCTNTSNPMVIIGAGLLAKRAVEKGLKVPPYVKTSFAPGSKIVSEYLIESGLMPYLEKLGFHLAAFGCTTCIGNSGPLAPGIEELVKNKQVLVASVLSGNRNFEARIHQQVRANFLASPPLVIAFALSGKIDVNLMEEPVGYDGTGKPVYLKEIWPSNDEIVSHLRKWVKKDYFKEQYAKIFQGDENWGKLQVSQEINFSWSEESSYITRPPFFENFSLSDPIPSDIEGARALLVLGDSVTTDHISPAGAIPAEYPAGKFLLDRKIKPADFNSYGSRRGNYLVMTRGTFSNVRIKNLLVSPKEGGLTIKFPEREEGFIYDIARRYHQENVPLVVFAGKEYGSGSSRDWAAKGSQLLGIRAIIAESFERIHRSNLVGMGVLPLELSEGTSTNSLKLKGSETFSIYGIKEITPLKKLVLEILKENGKLIQVDVFARLDNEIEVEYFRSGGILPYVLKKLITKGDT